ncbi:translation initiation factor SUI1 [Apiospora rasikravindrae]|uniref:Translation initiation factor SUI1 n=1 Tax=Apiospora rasikravindrae TaxID=990691 RepID=A0ABR1RWK5_9PEZI
MSIENLKTYDPFADAEADVDAVQLGGKKEDYVHIRIQQRNGRKTLTTVQGLPPSSTARRSSLSSERSSPAMGLELDPKIIKIHGF